MKTKIIQNLIVFILLAQIANVDCDLKAKAIRKKNSTTIANEVEGWGGPPELVREGKNPQQSEVKDYFYLKANGKASKKAMEQDSETAIITTCTDAANLVGSYEILTHFMDEHIQSKKGSDESGIVSLKLDETNSFSCKYIQSDDKKLKTKDCRGTVKNRGTALCWPTTSNGSWETCACLSYIRFPGGQDAVLKKLEFSE